MYVERLGGTCYYHIYGSVQYSEDGVRKLLQSVGAYVHFTLRLVPEDLVLQGLFEQSDIIIFSCTECSRRMRRFSDRCFGESENKKYKTLWNIGRKMVFNEGLTVFNKTGSARIT